MSEYYIHILILICIYSILAQGFNLSFGLGRLFNLAHVAIYAIGAYTTALLSTDLELGFAICLVTSVFTGGVCAALIAAISFRLSQDYFAIGSLAFSAVINALLINWKQLTNGVLGIAGIPKPEIFSIDFQEIHNFFYLSFILAVMVQVFFVALAQSAYARSLKAQAESDISALSIGKETKGIRMLSFFIASCFASLAGALYVYYINYVDPSSFSLTEMIFVLTIVIVGRPGSIFGVLLSCSFLVILPELLRFCRVPNEYIGPGRQFANALILFLVVYIFRGKLFPVERKV